MSSLATITPLKTLSFDFFTVELPEKCEKTFEQLLTEAAQKSVIYERIVAKESTPIRWEFLELLPDGLWVGEITRIRDDVVPNKAARNRPRQRLEIGKDEGTTEDTVFAYDPTSGVLVAHSNRYGVSGHDIANYFLKLAKAGEFAQAHVVLTPEGVQQISNFAYFDSLIFKIARPSKGPMPRSGDSSVDSNIDAAAEMNAKYFEVKLSVGRSKAKMFSDRVSKAVASILAMASQPRGRPVRKLCVSGMNNSGAFEEFDLLHNRLKSRQPVTISADRDIPYSDKKIAAQRAFADHKVFLQKNFSSQSSNEPTPDTSEAGS